MKLKSPASDSLGEGQRTAQSTLGNEHNLSNQSQEQGGDKTEKFKSPFLAADLVGESRDEAIHPPELESSVCMESQEEIPPTDNIQEDFSLEGPSQDIQEFSTLESTQSEELGAGGSLSDTHSSAMSSIPLGQGNYGGGVSSEPEGNKRKNDSGSETELSQSLLKSPSQKSDKKKKAKMPPSPRPCGGQK